MKHLLYLVVLFFLMGCGNSSGGGEAPKSAEKIPPVATEAESPPPIEQATPAPMVATEEKTPEEPVSLGISFKQGNKAVYELVNAIEVMLPGLNQDETITQRTFLNAVQSVEVGKSSGKTTQVTIDTNHVVAGVDKPSKETELADKFLQQTAQSIEGSRLIGQFDKQGRGTDLELEGEGTGLNPMGPLIGSQQEMIGLMGIVLPNKPVEVGDTWTAKCDFGASVSDLFEGAESKIENSEVTVTYTLLEVNRNKGVARLGISSKGAPTITVSRKPDSVKVNMQVGSLGQATVSLKDGWLNELRLETSVDMTGYIYNKQVVRTITKRVK